MVRHLKFFDIKHLGDVGHTIYIQWYVIVDLVNYTFTPPISEKRPLQTSHERKGATV
jgi:hypothetical protein